MENKQLFRRLFLLVMGALFSNMSVSMIRCDDNHNLDEMLNASPSEIHATIDQDYARVTKEKWDSIWNHVFKVLVAYKIIDPERVSLGDFKMAWQGKNGWFFIRVVGSALVALRELSGIAQDGYELYQLKNVKRDIERAIDLELAMRHRRAAGLTDAQDVRNTTFEEECDDAGLVRETENPA